VRYVGRTNNSKRRLSRHLSDRSWHPEWHDGALVFGSPKVRWIRELRRLGLRPLLTVVEEVEPPELAPERESRWIFHHIHQGAALTNGFYTLVPDLVQAIRATPLDYLHEPLDSEAWAPLARIDSQPGARLRERLTDMRPDHLPCCPAPPHPPLLMLSTEIRARAPVARGIPPSAAAIRRRR
jgi:hypothetical protein